MSKGDKHELHWIIQIFLEENHVLNNLVTTVSPDKETLLLFKD